MSQTDTKRNNKTGLRALFAVCLILGLGFTALFTVLRVTYRRALYGDPGVSGAVISGVGALLSCALAYAGVRLLKTKRIVKLAPFIFLFGTVMCFVPRILGYGYAFTYRFFYIGDVSFYAPAFAMLTVFMAGLAARYARGWKWQCVPMAAALLAIPCLALLSSTAYQSILIAFFAWFFFTLMLSREGRMQTPWYIFAAVCAVFLALFVYHTLNTPHWLARIGTVLHRGLNDPLNKGYTRVSLDSLFRAARLFGPAQEPLRDVFFGDGQAPLSLVLFAIDYTHVGFVLLMRCGWVVFILFYALQFVIPCLLFAAAKRAPNGYAKYFTRFLSLMLLGRVLLNVFSVFFSDISVPLPFMDAVSANWMTLFLLTAAFTLLVRGETDVPVLEQTFSPGDRLTTRLCELYFPSMLALDDVFDEEEDEEEAATSPTFRLFRFLQAADETAKHDDPNNVFISADTNGGENAALLAELLREGGKNSSVFVGDPLGTDRENDCYEAYRAAGVFVRVVSDRAFTDAWSLAAAETAPSGAYCMTVQLPPDETGEEKTRAFAKRLLAFLN